MKNIPLCLVVEDDPINNKMIKMMLNKASYDVLQAYSGQEALRLIKTNKVDVILLDILMPGMDGFELATYLKNERAYKRIPIIMITALEDKKDRVRGFDVGADDFLTKPIDNIELLSRVHNLLKLKKSYDELETSYEIMREQVRLSSAIYDAIVPPQIMHFPNCRLQWFSIVEEVISGDWFHAHYRLDGKIAVLLSDSVGHGLSATLVSVMIHSIYQSLIHVIDSADMMNALNNNLFKALGQNPMSLYCTAIFLLFDPVTKTADYLSAGHPPVIIKSQGTYTTLSHENGGIPLGIMADVNYQKMHLKDIERLYLYTDGLLDYVDYDQDHLKGLVEVQAEASGLSHLEDIMYRASDQYKDDLTLVEINLEAKNVE